MASSGEIGTATSTATVPVLEVRQVEKRYPGVVALAGVSLALQAGEVRALLGKNGAGKSTLVRILSGATRPDSGELFLAGRPVRFENTADAQRHGIATVYQELSLVPGLSVAENVMLGRWSRTVRLGVPMIDRRELYRRAGQALDMIGAKLRLNDDVARLSTAQQQIVEIAKAVSFEPKVLIFDEPTSSLPIHEVDTLLDLVRRLANQGVSIIYVSHRMQEIPRVADSLTILRDGKVVGTMASADATSDDIARLMLGSTWERGAIRSRHVGREVVLSVRGMSRPGRLRDVSFDVHRGEVLGIAGLLGSGRTELLRAIMGLDRAGVGTVTVDGRRVRAPSPARMLSLGVGLTPEDRKREGLVLVLNVRENLSMAAQRWMTRRGVVMRRRERQMATAMKERLSISTPSLDVMVETLSGGNQQKVVIGKWLLAQTRVLLLDEPTRGVDIHAKDQIYALIRDLAAEGMGIVFVSSELEELPAVCDRILVLNQGRLTGDLAAADTDPERIQALAMKEA